MSAITLVGLQIDASEEIFIFRDLNRDFSSSTPTVEDTIEWPIPIGETLFCKKEPGNNHSAVAVCRSLDGKQIAVGHIPAYLGPTLFEFLSLPECSVTLFVTGNRVNRGGGFGLEVPVKARLEGHSKAVEWAKKNITKLMNEHDRRVTYCNR